jgi:hypothetical protein
MFHLPVDDSGRNAEVPLRNRPMAHSVIKERFWAKLARRLDLTGRGSLVLHYPRIVDPERELSSVPDRTEAMMEAFEARADMLVLLDEAKMRDSALPQQVATQLEETTPQFFLRNVPRLEKDANPRHLRMQYAVWREEEEPLEYTDRYPRHRAPEMIDELSPVWSRKIMREVHDAVHGFAWEAEVDFDKPPPQKIHPSAHLEPRRISVNDLKLDPAKANRQLPDQRWQEGFESLAALFDGSRNPGEEPATKKPDRGRR